MRICVVTVGNCVCTLENVDLEPCSQTASVSAPGLVKDVFNLLLWWLQKVLAFAYERWWQCLDTSTDFNNAFMTDAEKAGSRV